MFRTRKFNTCPPSPKEFVVPVTKDIVDEDGTRYSEVVEVNASSIGSNLPNTEDYKLSALLRAGVPLNFVSSDVLDNGPSEAEASAILDSLPSSNPSNNE